MTERSEPWPAKVLDPSAQPLSEKKGVSTMISGDQEQGIESPPQLRGIIEEAYQDAPLSPGDENQSAPMQQDAGIESLQSETGSCANNNEEAMPDSRRSWSRHKLSLPIQVNGCDQIEGEWQEVAETVNVSRSGALLRLRKRVRHQTLLHLSLPLPVELRFYQYEAPLYDVYAIILRIEPPQDGVGLVAVEFVGQNPPPGFSEKPWSTYQREWNRIERRREPRQERYEPVMVEYFDEAMQIIKRGVAITENVSLGGTRLCAKAVPFDFTWVKVICAEPMFESYAVLCNRYSSEDGFERLCLRFLDNTWPI
jgi:hypothetical protein